MRYAILFPLIGAGILLVATQHGGWTWLLIWPALSFLLIGMAYGLKEPRFFGKHADGTLAWWSVLLLLPYHLFNTLLWHVARQVHHLRSSERYVSQITPDLWVSRRLSRREVPQGVVCVVDMTCEFPAGRGLADGAIQYRCLPTLDHRAPRPEQARTLLEELRTIQGGVLIHCAQGHGRSAMLAAALLVAKGLAKDPEDAIRMVKSKRPNVRISRHQRTTLAAVVEQLKLNP